MSETAAGVGQPVKVPGTDVVFSGREAQVIIGMARGHSNKEIGKKLDLSDLTVKTHVRRIFSKAKVHDRAGFISWGYRKGLLQGLKTYPMTGTGVPLTNRERQITELVILGLTNAEIGRRVFLSEDTVKTHLRKTFKKVGAVSRAHLVTIAYQHELVPRELWEE